MVTWKVICKVTQPRGIHQLSPVCFWKENGTAERKITRCGTILFYVLFLSPAGGSLYVA